MPSIADPLSIYLEFELDYQYSSSVADEVDGITRRYRNGYVGNVHLGTMVYGGWVYAGVNYERWIAGRTTPSQRDTLVAELMGPEVGILKPINPRLFWLFRVSAIYPTRLYIESTAGDYAHYRGRPILYQGRAAFGIYLTEYTSFLLEGGFRFSDFTRFRRGEEQYTPAGFDLSGVFLGLGLAGHL